MNGGPAAVVVLDDAHGVAAPAESRTTRWGYEARASRLVSRPARLRWSLLAAAIAAALTSFPAYAHEPGQLDPGFGRDGVRIIDLGRSESAEAVFPRDGQILLVGQQQLEPGGPYNVALTRLTSDGRIDRSFGDEGRVLIRPTERRYNPSTGWASAPDDGVVVFGYSGDRHYLLAVRANGAVDRGFGDDGVLLDGFVNERVLPLGVVVQPNGRILLLARTEQGSLIRAYRSDGSRARGFGRNGNVRIEGNYPLGGAPVYRSDGRILVAGQPDHTIGREGGPAREVLFVDALLRDGSRDMSFGQRGRARMSIDIPAGDLIVEAATVLPGGAIAVGGYTGFFSSDALVARFTADGRPDLSFGGGDGWRRFDLGPVDIISSIVGLPKGRLAVVGSVLRHRFGHDDARKELFVAALCPDGRFWRAFGTDGVVRGNLGGRSAVATDAVVVKGKLIVVGGRDSDMFAARYFLR